MSPYNKCVYHECKNTSLTSSTFRFPVNDRVRSERWIRNSGNPSLDFLTKEELRRRYICAAHFLPFDICKGPVKSTLLGAPVPIHFQFAEGFLQKKRRDADKEIDMPPSPDALKVKIPTISYRKRSRTASAERLISNSSSPLSLMGELPKSNEQDTGPGPSGNSLCENTSSEPDDLDSSFYRAGYEDPLGPTAQEQCRYCRFCGEYKNDCENFIDNDKPYIKNNKTTLKLNDISIELDFNDALPKTVCRICDRRLQVVFAFVKEVKEAQDALINLSNKGKEEVEKEVVVKTEFESPTPDENEVADDIGHIKDEIVDSITVTETEFVKQTPFISNKRKTDEDTPKTKKPKATKDVKHKNELVIDIKEETAEIDEAYEAEYLEFSDTETDVNISELELATRPLASMTNKDTLVNRRLDNTSL